MTDHRLELPPPGPARIWGDRGPWVPDTVGRRGKTAEAPWKTDPDPDFPDTVFDGGRVGDVTVMACAARGAKHRFEGAARQDAAMAVTAAGAWALAAVADGVGSVPDSHLAATAAVRTALGELARGVELIGAEALLRGPALFKQLCLRLERLEGPKTTLTLGAVAAAPDAEGNYQWWVARIGDSPAYLLHGGRLTALFANEREDEYGTATAAMPTRDLKGAYREQHGRLRPGQALVLVSDGIGDLIATDERRAAAKDGPIDDDAAEYYARHWQQEPSPVDFLRQTQTRRRTFDDDRSAAVFWTAPASAPQASTLRPGTSLRTGPQAVQDIEMSAARTGTLEIRTAVTKGAASQRERRSRISVIPHGDRLVVIAVAAAARADAPVDRWIRRLRKAAKWLEDAHASPDWTAIVWSRALQSFAEEPDFDPRGLATAVLSLEPTAAGADYTLSVSAGLAVSIAGAGLHQAIADLRPPEGVYPDPHHGGEFRLYADQLAPAQTLLLTNGVDPARIAGTEPRPGPLQALAILQAEPAEDGLIATVWSEP
jgi:serine/threonine protein phosphatase PrpC